MYQCLVRSYLTIPSSDSVYACPLPLANALRALCMNMALLSITTSRVDCRLT